jgi:hypothetical protein
MEPDDFQKTLNFGIEVFSKMNLVDLDQNGVDQHENTWKRFVLAYRLIPQSGLVIEGILQI